MPLSATPTTSTLLPGPPSLTGREPSPRVSVGSIPGWADSVAPTRHINMGGSVAAGEAAKVAAEGEDLLVR